jgi:predicted GIY-YIG superfamily endonuclease
MLNLRLNLLTNKNSSVSVGEYVSKFMLKYDHLGFPEGSEWFSYMIRSKTGHTYVGSTNSPRRRLQQHNRLMSGGAKSTARGTHWRPMILVRGFRTKIECLQFEWAWKHQKFRGTFFSFSFLIETGAKKRGVRRRVICLDNLLKKERWTLNAPLASEITLSIYCKSGLMLQAECIKAL